MHVLFATYTSGLGLFELLDLPHEVLQSHLKGCLIPSPQSTLVAEQLPHVQQNCAFNRTSHGRRMHSTGFHLPASSWNCCIRSSCILTVPDTLCERMGRCHGIIQGNHNDSACMHAVQTDTCTCWFAGMGVSQWGCRWTHVRRCYCKRAWRLLQC